MSWRVCHTISLTGRITGAFGVNSVTYCLYERYFYSSEPSALALEAFPGSNNTLEIPFDALLQTEYTLITKDNQSEVK